MDMIRVLQDLSALDGGGVAKLLYDYYENMDHNIIHYDFIIYNFYEHGMYETPLEQMGCKIYRIPTMQQDKQEALKRMEQVVREGRYDVVHSHFGRLAYHVLGYAKKYNVPVRIAHSHIAYEPMGYKARMAAGPRSALTKRYATHLFACGNDAGRYMWGDKEVDAGKVIIMKNAINTNRYRFSESVRCEKRRELGIEDKLALGIVSRLSSQKNFPYLFKVYGALLSTRSDVVLLVAGRGLEEASIKKLADTMGITDRIRFLGIRNDVPDLLNAFDVFLLPSLYEGLPVVLIEAQANGLMEIVSDKMTSEMTVTDLITQLPVDEASIMSWVEKINLIHPDITKRSTYADSMAAAGYDIRMASREMMEFYLSQKRICLR